MPSGMASRAGGSPPNLPLAHPRAHHTARLLYLYRSEATSISISISFGGSDETPSFGSRHSRVVLADATTILLAAPAMSFKLTMGMSPF